MSAFFIAQCLPHEFLSGLRKYIWISTKHFYCVVRQYMHLSVIKYLAEKSFHFYVVFIWRTIYILRVLGLTIAIHCIVVSPKLKLHLQLLSNASSKKKNVSSKKAQKRPHHSLHWFAILQDSLKKCCCFLGQSVLKAQYEKIYI